MYELSYKTRGNGNPRGKERVYFTAHSEDFPLYFEEICNDIFVTQNCAIYYDGSLTEERDEEEAERLLSDMQLFVMPITSRFLYTENIARCRDFAYAIKHNIPVLPLMYESGLEEEFNRICGELQFLDKHAKDTTAIPYEEKLEKFLSSVLVGDDLAARIREAFDAYIFLSYRKKDRKYAQELMRLIHKNEFCRDIAIWYDEFLVPGENFSESIASALEKSRLFVLTVTPSLLEKNFKGEDNYVMQVEYPEARRAGKTVLPAEMLPTDPDGLKNGYDALPDVVNPYEEGALRLSLIETLEALADKENDNSPEHIFFIGLAYLGGIDVEVDRERALELISRSADMGLPEAMEKLVSMYEEGNGAKRDYEAALKWKRRLVDAYRDIFEGEKTQDNLINLFEAMWHVGDALAALARIEEAIEVYEAMQDLAYRHSEEFECERMLNVSVSKLGDMYEELGDTEGAFRCAHMALGLASKRVTVEKNATALHDLIVAYLNIGDITRDMGKLSVACEAYTNALDAASYLLEKLGTAEEKNDVSVVYGRLGSIYRLMGQLPKSLKSYHEALDLQRSICEELGTPMARRMLALAENHVGKVLLAMEEYGEAETHYRCGLELMLGFWEDVGTLQSMRDVAVAYNNLGDLAKSQKDYEGATKHYKAGLDFTKRIAAVSQTVSARRDLAISFHRLGDTANGAQSYEEALEYFKRGFDIYFELAEETGSIGSRRDLSVGYYKLGYTYNIMGNIDEAEKNYKRLYEIASELSKEIDTVEIKRDLSIACGALAKLAEKRGELRTALDYQLRALECDEYLAENAPSPTALRDLAITNSAISRLAEKLGETELWERTLNRAAELYLKLTEGRAQRRDYADFTLVLDRLGGFYRDRDDKEKAVKWYQVGLQVAEILMRGSKVLRDYDNYAIFAYKLGCVTQDREMLELAQRVWTDLAKKAPESYSDRVDMVKEMLEELN